MPNLLTNDSLLAKYASGHSRKLAKALGTVAITDSFDQNHVFLNPQWSSAFQKQQKYNVVMTFLDLTGFSSKTRRMKPDQIVAVLEDYYSKVVPRIYEYGGVIEKMIGDGVISIFGPPFLSNVPFEDLLRRAESSARAAMLELEEVGYESKCALHHGEVLYYSTLGATTQYLDLTVVGEVVTELFRLESVSENGYINYYSDTAYSRMIDGDLSLPCADDIPVVFVADLSKAKTVKLPGIGERTVMVLKPQ